jgi:2'-5' RNA ligase
MSRRATARLFVAVDPPAAVCEQLAVWAREVAAALGSRARARARAAGTLRLLEPEAMHLTVCFLGSRPVEEIGRIGSALARCAATAGELSVGAPLWLPPRRPRTLAVAIHDRGGELARLHEVVAGAVSGAIDWQPERRGFRGHVTVARAGRVAAVDRGAAAVETDLPATPALSFTPASIVLYRSWLAPAGASYEALATSGLVPSESKSSEGSEEDAAEPGVTPQASVEGLGVGIEPSSHSGSEPSSQE